MSKLKIGFLGLGLMGRPMALNIHKAGFPLIVYNRTPKKTVEFKKLGVEVAHSPSDLASKVDIVISCVTAPKDVRQIYLGRDGVVMGAKKGLVAVDMSTIGPKSAREIGEELDKFGVEFLDAPVTGGTWGAEQGSLTIFVGGSEPILTKVHPVLSAMGTNIQYMGKLGNGQAIKLINNFYIASSLSIFSECLVLAEEMGLSKNRMIEVLETTPTLPSPVKAKLENYKRNKFPKSFSLSNMSKDVSLAKESAPDYLKILKLVEGMFRKGKQKGLGEEDVSVVIKVIRGLESRIK